MMNNSVRRIRAGRFGLLISCLFLVAFSAAEATQISINLGPAPNITSQISTSFDDLNGIQLQGQTLSLDFLFASGEFTRLFSVTDPSFTALITLNTNGSGIVGFLDGTGFLLDQNGNVLESSELLGSASGDDGTMSVGLFPLLSGHFSAPLDFFGIHTNLLLPDDKSIMITGAEFQLITPGANNQDVFGVGPGVPRDIVPDAGSSLLLISLTVVALTAMQRAFPAFHRPAERSDS